MATFENEVKFALASILRGFRNGTFYGTKIRLPHAFVMTLLFSFKSDLRYLGDRMSNLTWEHSRNLALFVGFYKAALALGRLIRIRLGDKIAAPPGRPSNQFDTLLAGGLIGHIIWGRYTSINSQIVMYLTARVMLGLGKIAAEKGFPIAKDLTYETQVHPVWASIIWAIVMWQFEFHPDKLQSSLTESMKFLYHDSNQWSEGVVDFLPSPATAAVFVYVTLRAREELLKKSGKQ
jgi:peroxisomal membrane protein 4